MAKVLLVEDDNNLREIYEARLQAEGYDVVAASDGEEALVVAKNEEPDLVISDVMMPKISGFEMLDIMRNTESLKNVKVIMLTALGQAEDQSRADKLGADRYLVKSQVTLEDIVNVAQDLLVKAGAIADPAAASAPAAAPAAPAPAAAVVAEPAPVTPHEPAAPVLVAEPPAPPAVADPQPVMPVATEPVVAPVAPQSATPTVTEPAAQPTTPAPTTDPMPIATPTTTVEPQTSAEEEQAVAAQIENFVDAQSGAAPAEVAQPSEAAPASDVQPEITTPETAPQAANPTTPEQQAALDTAVETLNNAASGEPVAETTTPDSEAKPDGGVSHKKVIKPLDNSKETTKSIDQLLAEEDAKQILTPSEPSAVTPAAAVAPTKTTPEQSSKQAADGDDFDPNSIAL